jgi:subtilase family serine protease
MTSRFNKYKTFAFLSAVIFLFSCEGYDLQTYPDLTIESTNVSPNVVSKGNSVTVSCKVKNQGNGSADFSIWTTTGLYYFLSTDTIYDIGDVNLDTHNIDDIGPLKSRDVLDVSLTIPFSTTAGYYYILFYIDEEDEIEELNEDNNVGNFGIQVTN